MDHSAKRFSPLFRHDGGAVYLSLALRDIRWASSLSLISLAVAAVPEGLPAIISIILSLGVQTMARKRAIIRKLPTVETLGAMTVVSRIKPAP